MATTAYASMDDLLMRVNMQRLAQLAVPTGGVMPEEYLVYAALRADTSVPIDPALADVLAKTVQAVQVALDDGAAFMQGFGLSAPAVPVPAPLVRINAQLAMHYLMERAGMLDEASLTVYKGITRVLEQHAKGQIALVPPDPSALTADTADISSNAARYVGGASWGFDTP